MAHPSFYGFLSNSYTSALVSPDGVIEWFPCPRFDSHAIFCRLLDQSRGGFFSIQPSIPFHSRQTYDDNTNIVITTFQTEHGIAEVKDFLPIGRVAIWRRIKTEIPLELVCRPTFSFGAAGAAYNITDDGALFSHPGGGEAVKLIIHGPMKKLEHRDHWEIGPGEVTVVLRYARDYQSEQQMLDEPLTDPHCVEEGTRHFWQRSLLPYEGPYQDAFNRSMLVIRGLTYRTNGALLAAATTSLPEVVGETRQWDYRFVWVRDASYAAEALLLAGDPVACRRFIEFMLNTVDLAGKPYASPFYKVDGTQSSGEKELLWLAGYKNSRPVRVGNAASDQTQMDIEGDLLWVVLLYWQTTHDDTFIKEYWWAIDTLVSWVAENWNTPDASLWEFREDNDIYLHSQVMCWVSLHVGYILAQEVMHLERLAQSWKNVADIIAQRIWDDQKESDLPYLTQGRRHRQVDAALLTLPLYGFVEPGHPVFSKTLERIEAVLVENDFVYRYREDNMGTARYPFTLAGFWLARVYLRLGNLKRADELIAQQLQCATDLGLFAEHVDPKTFEPHGNFPQLFPHAALITTLIERQRLSEDVISPGQHPQAMTPSS
ncbi:glycoside hydrolase family 15 protein [Sulfobacillus thermosulfidooxidans]|uniref:glycoside hydrolase family 15 protein n=1 Tax=Sulfobacillus thermosulfidooxidans TaxID=28034 RepID=UPI00096B703A|nr:glycoside hydrolase family 15 protein [Sulfobacillus thermosulfidooxidans]OLZ08347.1 glycoside hydrolase family 15 [Sulfobacillus thermosulfidooxidans]OLZ13931.1 glycoside hydrolase family 15 [Sulfobacillus thermosulfidooxidans]OLZ20549.1 glycoside hydrolase family 15 [Sulfobacillus thermosulfidooxidans]